VAVAVKVPFPRTRKVGTRGRDVQQDHRALTRAGFWPLNKTGKVPRFYDAPIYTHRFAMHVREFQRRMKLPVTGQIDRATHNRLAKAYRGKNGALHAYGWYGAVGAKVMGDVAKKLRAQERLLLSSGSVTQRGVAAALMCVRHRSVIHYTQGGLRMVGVNRKMYPPNYPHYMDCSSGVTWWYYVSGARDPNGLGYNGQGYTGTQSNKGRATSYNVAPVMAVAFYGRPIGHEALVVKRGSMVVSHGSEPGPLLVNIAYRPVTLVKIMPLDVRPGFHPWAMQGAKR
jgi:hypothetical protein